MNSRIDKDKRSQGNFYCRPIMPSTFYEKGGQYVWLIKATFLNRGRGIHVFNNLTDPIEDH